jgi:O-antigen ligase
MNLDFIIPLLYPAAIAATLLSVWWPQFGVYFLVFILPLQTLRYELHEYPFGASIIDIVLLGVVIGIFLHRRAPLFSDFPVRGLLLGFVLYLYVSLWNGAALLNRGWPLSFADSRLSDWKNLAELCLLCFFVFAAIKTERQIKYVVMVLFLSAFAVSYDFYQTVHAEDFSHYSYALRYAGVMGYAGVNGLAAFEAQFSLFLLGCYSSTLPKPLKVAAPIVLLACLYGMLFSFSRGAYLAFVAGMIFVGLVQKRALLMVGVVVLIGATVLLPGAVVDRISGTYAPGEGSSEATFDNSTMERMIIWQDAFELAKSYPLRGTGFDTYRLLHRSLGFGDTHNFYLKVLLEEGLLGFLIFVALLWKMFRLGFDLFRDSSNPFYSTLGLGFAACMVGVAVVNIFGDRWSYQQVNADVWILFGLVCRARLLSTESETETVEKSLQPQGPNDEALAFA